jgi:DNA-binding response OmpR family regulator
MPEFEESAPTKSVARPSATFPTVPIAEVPLPAESAEPSVHRPIVLVVDEEPALADTLSKILTHGGYVGVPAYDAEDALETALLIPPQLVIADVKLPGMGGIELATALKGKFPDCEILLLAEPSATPEPLGSVKVAGHELEVVNKPIHPKDLLARVSESLKLPSAQAAVSD